MPWRPIGLALPTSWFIHLVVCRLPATARLPRSFCLPQAFAPLQSLTHDNLALHKCSRERSPEVCRPFSVTQPTKATAPGFAFPGSCCVFALTMCPDALLLRRPPWCLSTRLAPGVSPFSARLARDRLASRHDFPSCDWLIPTPFSFHPKMNAAAAGTPVPQDPRGFTPGGCSL
jgi:hypothetical protein